MFVIRFIAVCSLSLVACTTNTIDLQGTPIDAGPRDAGPRDGGLIRDAAGPFDAGELRDVGVDAGDVRDAGDEPDTGCSAGMPRVDQGPLHTLIFHGATRDLPLTIRNIGAGALVLESVDITPVAPTLPGEFVVPGCNSLPCSLDVVLCANESYELPVHFDNNDASGSDLSQLMIRTNQPGNQPAIWVELQAIRVECTAPQPNIVVTTVNPSAGQLVSVDGSSSAPGGPGDGTTITSWNWTWVSAPTPSPTINGQGTPQISFTPAADGTYMVSLDVENDCGAQNVTPATEVISIQ